MKRIIALILLALSMTACGAGTITTHQLKAEPFKYRILTVDEPYNEAYNRLLAGIADGAVPPLNTLRPMPTNIDPQTKTAWWSANNFIRVEFEPVDDAHSKVHIWEGMNGFTKMTDEMVMLFAPVTASIQGVVPQAGADS
ncbi:hypothetical protein [Pseudodesulfovibrio methanolicus]|uniref:Lipoprotein n=1 Tax=Pseudodesulfovibrio methanolicus TaxID=3126690 RepID=A0ABZ2IUJ6_9BACT